MIAPAGGLRLERIAERIAFIGDSLAAPFDNVVFTDPSDPGGLIVPRVRWWPNFRSAQFFDDGRFSATMTRALVELKCAIAAPNEPCPIFTPISATAGDGTLELVDVGIRRPDAILVVSCGGGDAEAIMHELYPHFAFDVEDLEGADAFAYEAPTTLAPWVVFGMIERRLAPLFHALAALRDAGFTRLHLLGLPPCNSEMRTFFKPVRLRMNVRRAMNVVMERWCAENGPTFVPIFDLLSTGGLQTPGLFWDEWHYYDEGARIVMTRLYEMTR